MWMAMVGTAVAALNVSVAYAGVDCDCESSNPPSDTSNSSNPGDPNNSDGYAGGFGTNWSGQDQNDLSGNLLPN